MQNIINGLPIAAVILLLAVGFAFLVKGADFLWRKFQHCEEVKGSAHHHWSYDCGYGNFTARNSRECDCFSGTE